jgi:predicted solute-binding protein
VSYLNTVPLVWGIERGPQRDLFDLRYALPSACADEVARGDTDIGILPVIEIDRHGLAWLPETGIACRGPVRSILFISRVEPNRVRTVAMDSGSRTSVMLTRVWLAERHGVEPATVTAQADLPRMLEHADAALVIGDAALRLDPERLRRDFRVYDLGEEWMRLTGYPFVFALWSGRRENLPASLGAAFLASCRYGLDRIEEIVAVEATPRGITPELARDYLTRHVILELKPRELEGMQLFWQRARALEKVTV